MDQRITTMIYILAMTNEISVNAITADIYPNCTSCTLNGFATFSCTASPYVAGITFVVAGVDPTMWASRGISQSAPAYSGNATTTNLTVLGTIANNGLLVTCRVFVGTTYQDIVPPAVLTVEDPTTATSSSSQLFPTSTPSLTTTPSPTTTTPAPSLMASVSAVIAVPLVVIVVMVTLGVVVIIKYKKSRRRPSASKITTNTRPLSTATLVEWSESSPSTNDNSEQIIHRHVEVVHKSNCRICTFIKLFFCHCSLKHSGSADIMPPAHNIEVDQTSISGNSIVEEEQQSSHQTTLQHSSTQPSSAGHRDDGSTSVPTSEGPSTAPSLHTCIPVAPGGGVVYITTEMEHGDTSSVGCNHTCTSSIQKS